jgi:hypothetical protein
MVAAAADGQADGRYGQDDRHRGGHKPSAV